MSADDDARLRVLFLHGSRQTGGLLEHRLEPLLRRVSAFALVSFPDGPVALPLAPGETVPLRAWWQEGCAVTQAALVASGVQAASDAVAASAAAPSGVAVGAAGGWDVVAGFSAGAAVAHALAQSGALGRSLRGVLLFSGFDAAVEAARAAAPAAAPAVPSPAAPAPAPASPAPTRPAGGAGRELPPAPPRTRAGAAPRAAPAAAPPPPPPPPLPAPPPAPELCPLPSLHVYGSSDAAVAPAASARAAALYVSPVAHLHARGHCVPQASPDLDAVAAFLRSLAPQRPPRRPQQPQPPPQPPQQQPRRPPPQQQQQPQPACAPPLLQQQQQQQQQRAPAAALPPAAAAAAGAAAASCGGGGAPYAVSEAQADELASLGAIFGDEFELVWANPPLVRIAVAWHRHAPAAAPGGGCSGGSPPPPGRGAPWLFLEARMQPGYPEGAPLRGCALAPAARGQIGAGALRSASAAAAAAAAAASAAGEPAVFAAAAAAREWAEEHAPGGPPDGGGDGGGGGGGTESDSDDGGDGGCGAAEGGAAAIHKWWLDDVRPEDVAAAAAAAAAAEAEADAPAPPAGAVASCCAPAGAGAAFGREAGAAAHSRAWRFTVGLVGKPSSGKSTLFNALCRPAAGDAAKMAPHPFTTIEPNVGIAFAAAPCPCGALGLAAACAAAHGRPGLGCCARRHPVFVKDVAGLVPGAYAGRGRGNAFLADITECDALIHVVDASATTDSEGQPGRGDPAHDVAWVRAELHSWVYTNVASKFGRLRKRAAPRHAGADPDLALASLVALFSGYRAARPAVLRALARAGLDATRLTDPAGGLRGWGPAQLHSLVASFLRVRFPVLLALNKADLPGAGANVAALRAALPREPAEPCSALSEWWLARHGARLEYAEGAADARLRGGCGGGGCDGSGCDAAEDARLEGRLALLRARALAPWGGTGVLRALSRCVALRRPVWAFPVEGFDGCEAPSRAAPQRGALAAAPAAAAAPAPAPGGDGGGEAGAAAGCAGDTAPAADDGDGDAPPRCPASRVLRECLMLRPGTTLAELFCALSREGLARDEFVRAERLLPPGATAAGGGGGGCARAHRVMHKDEPLVATAAAAAAAAAAVSGGWWGAGESLVGPHGWGGPPAAGAAAASACLVLRVATSRRTPWQQPLRAVDRPQRGPAPAKPVAPPKVVPLEGKKEVFRFQRRKSNFSNQ